MRDLPVVLRASHVAAAKGEGVQGLAGRGAVAAVANALVADDLRQRPFPFCPCPRQATLYALLPRLVGTHW